MTGQTLEWLWLAHVLGPGARGCGGVLALYPTPGELLEAVGREDLSGLLAPAQAERLVTILMGDKVEPRREYISQFADFNRQDTFELPEHQRQGGN